MSSASRNNRIARAATKIQGLQTNNNVFANSKASKICNYRNFQSSQVHSQSLMSTNEILNPDNFATLRKGNFIFEKRKQLIKQIIYSLKDSVFSDTHCVL